MRLPLVVVLLTGEGVARTMEVVRSKEVRIRLMLMDVCISKEDLCLKTVG